MVGEMSYSIVVVVAAVEAAENCLRMSSNVDDDDAGDSDGYCLPKRNVDGDVNGNYSAVDLSLLLLCAAMTLMMNSSWLWLVGTMKSSKRTMLNPVSWSSLHRLLRFAAVVGFRSSFFIL